VSIIATICARGGSKGLPRKNVLPFAGQPLIAHTIAHALACPRIAGVYVSTDDDEIAQVAAAAGAIVPYRRPAELATDAAGKLPVIEHLVQHLEGQGQRVTTIVDLQPTSPLRVPADIDAALDLAAGADLVVSVCEPSHNPYYSLAEAGPDGALHLSKGAGALRRQDVPAVWGLNGAVYVWQREALPRAVRDGFWSIRILPSVMPRERSIDIDDAQDFALAEWLHQQRKLKSRPCKRSLSSSLPKPASTTTAAWTWRCGWWKPRMRPAPTPSSSRPSAPRTW
jgi:N-acylneuraminate cytidylyltransferase